MFNYLQKKNGPITDYGFLTSVTTVLLIKN